MKLKNIYDRNQFAKVYEFGSAGGKGEGTGDGFYNNAALQDTLVGQLFNGVFRSVTWLYRKSKEKFMINKLTARLTNELFRGVILYCFANDIPIGKIQEGQTPEEAGAVASEVKPEEQKQEEPKKQNLALGAHKDAAALGAHKDAAALGAHKDAAAIGAHKDAAALGGKKEFSALNPSEQKKQAALICKNVLALGQHYDLDAEGNEKYQSLAKNVEENKYDLKPAVDFFLNLNDNNKQDFLSKYEKNSRNFFISVLPEGEKNKWNQKFNPELSSQDIKNRMTTPESRFQSIRNDISEDLDNPSPETIKNAVGVKFDLNKVSNIKDVDQFRSVVKEMEEYLSTLIEDYPKMTGMKKNNIQAIYKNYIISKMILDKVELKNKKEEPTKVTSESVENLNEDFAHAPMSEPRAGSDPEAEHKPTDVTVGQILTKRDREKYKEHEKEFKLNLRDVDLARIEKLVEGKGDAGREEVTKFVNPENLKSIQMTAEGLFFPEKVDLYKKANVEDKSIRKEKLKKTWDNEVTKIYASFSNLMLISAVDIRKENYRNDLENKVAEGAKKNGSDLINQEKSLNIVSKLDDVLDPNGDVGLIEKNCGKRIFLCIDSYKCSTYTLNSQIYNKPNELYAIRILNSFDSMITTEGTKESYNDLNENFSKFKEKFAKDDTDQVYFIFTKTSKDPTKGIARGLILNVKQNGNGEIIYFSNNNKKYLELSQINENTIFDDKRLYPFKFDVYRRFKNDLDKNVEDKFKMTGILLDATPEFFKNKENIKKIKLIIEKPIEKKS